LKLLQRYRDKDILNAIEHGENQKVLSFLYTDVLPKVKRFIIKNQGTDDQAKDIFQDAVIRFYASVKQGQFEGTSSVSTYIFSISKNLWINEVKKNGRHIKGDIPEREDVSNNFLNDIISKERTEAANQLLGQLGDNCRQLLKYSIYDNLSMKEICEKMGYSSIDIAKTYNYRCKQKLMSLAKENPNIINLFK